MTAEKITEQLQGKLSDRASIDMLIQIFEEMCELPADGEQDELLYETGTFDFTGEKRFYFSLTRQLDGENDEPVQIQLEITYCPSDENKKFSETLWLSNNPGSRKKFFSKVKKSKAYIWAAKVPYVETIARLEQC